MQDLLTNQEKDLNRLQKLLHIAQTDLEQERRLKEAGDSQIRMLTTELRRTEDEIKDIITNTLLSTNHPAAPLDPQ